MRAREASVGKNGADVHNDAHALEVSLRCRAAQSNAKRGGLWDVQV